MKTKEIAEYIQTKLLENKFIVHRYDAYSTCSIYLKLDYGASNSIRISDHKGYEYLSYKYEVNQKVHSAGWAKDKKGCWRYHCPANKTEIDNMINIIIHDRQYKKCFNDYYAILQEYKRKSKYCKGFWEQAKEVNL